MARIWRLYRDLGLAEDQVKARGEGDAMGAEGGADREDVLVVIFSSGDFRKRIGISWLIRTLSHSPIAHAAISYKGIVLDPTLAGIRFYPLTLYAHHPALLYAVSIPISGPINLGAYQPGQPIGLRSWMVWARWLTRGHWPKGDDCLTPVLELLESAGITNLPLIPSAAALYYELVVTRKMSVCRLNKLARQPKWLGK